MARKRPVQSKNVVTFSGTALTLHDDPEGIRRDFIKTYKQQQAALRRLNDVLKNLQDTERPAFELWYSAAFAEEHEALVRLHNRYEELLMLSDATEDYRLYAGGTYAQAYAKVVEAHGQGRLMEMMNDVIRDDDSDFNDHRETEFHDPDAHFDDVTRDFYEMSEEVDSRPVVRSESTQLQKNLYRQLARRLHPDFNPNPSALEQALWHQLQDAYKCDDWSRINDIHNQLNGPAAAGFDLWLISIGDIAGMISDQKKRLTQIEASLAHERKADYWDFQKRIQQKKFIDKLTSRLAYELKDEMELVRFVIHELEDRFASWSRPRRPKPARNSKKKPAMRRKNSQRSKPKDFWDEHFTD